MIARPSWCRCGAPADGLRHGRPLCLRCLAEEVDPSQAETWAERWPRLWMLGALGLLAVILAGAGAFCALMA